MIIELEDGQIIQGSELEDVWFRSSLDPIPCSSEFKVRLNEQIAPMLMEGKIIKAGRNKTPMKIVYVFDAVSTKEQGGVVNFRLVIALHENTVNVSYRLDKAVIRQNITLSEIYQACGSKTPISKDFKISRFYCYKGSIPTFEIANVLHESAGVIRWIPNGNTIEFWRLRDLFQQEPVSKRPEIFDVTQKSEFLKRHEIPTYISLKADGTHISGNLEKTQSIQYVPHKTEQELNLMSDVLINAKEVEIDYEPTLHAGDIIMIGDTKFVIITAVHRSLRIDGNTTDSTTLWLGLRSAN